jgi:hypothetical protein
LAVGIGRVRLWRTGCFKPCGAFTLAKTALPNEMGIVILACADSVLFLITPRQVTMRNTTFNKAGDARWRLGIRSWGGFHYN